MAARTLVVRAYVTEAEYEYFHAQAHKRHITLSEHIRACLLLDLENAGITVPEQSLREAWSFLPGQVELALTDAGAVVTHHPAIVEGDVDASNNA